MDLVLQTLGDERRSDMQKVRGDMAAASSRTSDQKRYRQCRCPFMNKRLFDIYLDENGNVVIVFVCNRCKLKCKVYIINFKEIRIEPRGCHQTLRCALQHRA